VAFVREAEQDWSEAPSHRKRRNDSVRRQSVEVLQNTPIPTYKARNLDNGTPLHALVDSHGRPAHGLSLGRVGITSWGSRVSDPRTEDLADLAESQTSLQ
jgi:hypothetical protein